MRWIVPISGETRVVKCFLFRKVKINNDVRWLETAVRVQKFNGFRQQWENVKWIDGVTYYRDTKTHFLHSDNGPALVFPDGSNEWYLNGKRHRIDGPAIKYADGSKSWYLNGRKHRTDGPAIEWANGREEWWVNGSQYESQEAINEIHS
jgi:hypothetical protein